MNAKFICKKVGDALTHVEITELIIGPTLEGWLYSSHTWASWA